MPATVTLILKGLIAVFVTPDKKQCIAGVVSQVPPDHQVSLSFRIPDPSGNMVEHAHRDPPNIGNNLRLEVTNISQQQITFRNHPIHVDRQHDPPVETQESFSWIVDFENIELYDRPIGAQLSLFNPILTFTNGELFTKAVSISRLFTVRGIFDTRNFGFVGTTIGAEFRLDQPPNSTAVFHNGAEPIVIPDPNQNWEIEINNDARVHAGIVTDANHYYRAVGLGLTEPERYQFMSFASNGPPAGPEAACFTGFFGQSQPTK